MNILGQWESEHGPTWEVDFKDLDEQLRFLRSLVSKYRQHPKVRDLATSILRDGGVPMRDKREQAIALGQWVQDHVYYVHELPERFQTPVATLRTLAGDCDDGTTLVCSLLESVGIPSRMVCMKLCPKGYRLEFCGWKHIFPAAVNEKTGALLPLDWSMKSYQVRQLKNPVEFANEHGKQVSLKMA